MALSIGWIHLLHRGAGHVCVYGQIKLQVLSLSLLLSPCLPSHLLIVTFSASFSPPGLPVRFPSVSSRHRSRSLLITSCRSATSSLLPSPQLVVDHPDQTGNEGGSQITENSLFVPSERGWH